MVKVRLLAGLHPNTICRTYKFRFWPARELYPLAALCALQVPQELIESVYDLCPAAAYDAFTMQCFYAEDVNTLQWLYNKAPAVVRREHTFWKTLPLHHACENEVLDIVKFVYEAYPEGLAHKSKNGNPPLSYAFEFSTLPIIKYLIDEMDDDTILHHTNNFGRTPLHAAFKNSRKEVSDFVAESFPNFLNDASPEDGWLPLHYACHHADSTVGIKVLLKKYPHAAKIQDNKGRLPLALACKNEKFKKDYDVLALIIDHHPEAINAVDNVGNLPLDWATSRQLMIHMANKKAARRSAKRQRRT
mmetsp:Transcript_2559/g.4112  ORF Transcript_2559/g.4112 Transcript_2559/m.4112 type:complete len:303 (+) Transcript_2559:1379-2287(+)